MEAERVSVIILNYNGRKHLGPLLITCVNSVLLTDYPSFEVLFVDNASTDGSVDFIESRFGKNKKLRIIRNSRNYGFTEGNNIGIRKSASNLIALVNSDTRVEPKWLTSLVNTIKSQPRVGVVQSKLLLMNSPELLDCAGGLVDYYGYHFERGRGEEASDYNSNDTVFYAKGAAILIKRIVLKETGLFDPDFFMYFDEVDLCWRIWLSGYKVMFAADSIVYHASGSTASKLTHQNRMFFYTRNHLMVLIKNYSLQQLSKAIAVSILYEMRNAALSLARRRPLVSLAIVKGFFWNWLHLRETWSKRQTVQKFIRQVSDREVQKAMLAPYPPFPLYLVFSRFKYLDKMHKSKMRSINGHGTS